MANSKTIISSMDNQIGYALSIASLAPSVHNIQPWKVKIGQKQIEIIPQLNLLTSGDATNRETYISIGAFLQTLIIALAHVGIEANLGTINEDSILVKFNDISINKKLGKLFDAIEQRHTNRSLFIKGSVKKEDIQSLLDIKIADRIDGSVEVKQFSTTNEIEIHKYAQLIAKAIKIPMLSKEFCQELSELLTQNSKLGIPYKSMNSPVPYPIFRFLLKNNKLANYVARHEYNNWNSAPLILSICANGDSYKHWIEAGRLYQQCCLQATSLGYATSTSATLVEALNFHEDIEDMLDTKLRLMTTVRIGKPLKKSVKSGRYSTAEIVVS